MTDKKTERNNATTHDAQSELLDQVEWLNEEAKSLALNLAIFLAKKKKESKKLSVMEPDFIQLVNGTVKVVQEVTHIINAAKNAEKMIYEIPSGALQYDQLEFKLRSILKQCQEVMGQLIEQNEITTDIEDGII